MKPCEKPSFSDVPENADDLPCRGCRVDIHTATSIPERGHSPGSAVSGLRIASPLPDWSAPGEIMGTWTGIPVTPSPDQSCRELRQVPRPWLDRP